MADPISDSKIFLWGGAKNAFGHFERQRKRKRKESAFREARFLEERNQALTANTKQGLRTASSQAAGFAGAGFEQSGTADAVINETLYETALENTMIISGAAFSMRNARMRSRIQRSQEREELAISGAKAGIGALFSFL